MRFLVKIAMAMALVMAASPLDLFAQAKGKNRILSPGELKAKAKAQAKGNAKGEPGEILERFLQMPPERRRQALEQLPPARRRIVQRRLAVLEILSPEELRLLRGRYQVLADMAPDRQDAVRAEIRALRALPRPERRQRLGSEEAREKFSADELQLLYEVSGVPDEP